MTAACACLADALGYWVRSEEEGDYCDDITCIVVFLPFTMPSARPLARCATGAAGGLVTLSTDKSNASAAARAPKEPGAASQQASSPASSAAARRAPCTAHAGGGADAAEGFAPRRLTWDEEDDAEEAVPARAVAAPDAPAAKRAQATAFGRRLTADSEGSVDDEDAEM